MAGDWIKMRKDLSTDPAVILIAEATGLDEDSVVGKLHRVWCWADSQLRDGNAASVTKKWIDRYTNVAGFADAMERAGWLEVTEEGIAFPNFDRHNGQPAKARALTSIRVAASRQRNCNGASVTETLPEKRREEYIEPPNPPCVPQGDFSTREAAIQTWKTLKSRSIPPAQLDAQLKAIAGWTDSEVITAITEAVARNGRRLSRPKGLSGNGRAKHPDKHLDAEMMRANVVKDARRRGVPEDQIDDLVVKVLAKHGLSLQGAV